MAHTLEYVAGGESAYVKLMLKFDLCAIVIKIGVYLNSDNDNKYTMKNYSDLIKDKSKRTLTAKAYKFLWKCIDIIAESKGLNRYSLEMRPVKEKFSKIINHLIIDKEMTISEITELIKSRQFLNQ